MWVMVVGTFHDSMTLICLGTVRSPISLSSSGSQMHPNYSCFSLFGCFGFCLYLVYHSVILTHVDRKLAIQLINHCHCPSHSNMKLSCQVRLGDKQVSWMVLGLPLVLVTSFQFISAVFIHFVDLFLNLLRVLWLFIHLVFVLLLDTLMFQVAFLLVLYVTFINAPAASPCWVHLLDVPSVDGVSRLILF